MKNYHSYITEILGSLSKNQIFASAELSATPLCPGLNGRVVFYRHPKENGIFVVSSLFGLPDGKGTKRYDVLIRSSRSPPCGKNPNRGFCKSDAIQLPELSGNSGFAFSVFYTEEISRSSLLGKTVSIFPKSSPCKRSDEALACGLILPA